MIRKALLYKAFLLGKIWGPIYINESRLKAIRRLPNGWEEEQSFTVSGNAL